MVVDILISRVHIDASAARPREVDALMILVFRPTTDVLAS